MRFAIALIVTGAVSMASLAEPPPVPSPNPESVFFQAQAWRLDKALKQITKNTGIGFSLADGLGQEKINADIQGKTWTEAAKTLLKPYNYVVETRPDGTWMAVSIIGKNGDGKNAPPLKQEKPSILKRAKTRGRSVFHQLPAAAVTPLNLPLVTLKGMKKGQKISLDLPTGTLSLVHDNRFNHANGDITWVGFQENAGQAYRALITMGQSGPMGNLITPEGSYQIVSEGGKTYLVDINLAGLMPGSILEDQASPPRQTSAKDAASLPVGETRGLGSSSSETSGQAESSTHSTIDLLVVYSKGLAQADTRINHLTALTNQAFLDSKVNAQVRVVYRQPLNYTDTSDNTQALADLSEAKPPFDKIPALREQYGADLVSYIRPFHANTQGGCGIAWINGINGSDLSPDWAYSVVSDGYDQAEGKYYCGEQTLAHELGHNLGNVHDRPLSSLPGAFPYSYAWGIEGSFGTIMSYRQPSVYLFASPLLGKACHGQVCGYAEGDPNASDNTRTINKTAPIVAGFKPSLVPD